MIPPALLDVARAVPMAVAVQPYAAGLRRVGAELVGPCPVCGGRDRFAAHLRKQVFLCRGCGVGGDSIALIRHVTGASFAEAVEMASDGAAAPSTTRPRSEGDVSTSPSAAEPDRIALAGRVWAEARDPQRTSAERYLASRRLQLEDDLSGPVIRFHPRCGYRDDAGRLQRGPAMIAAMRCITTDKLTAVQRTFLDPDGRKLDRRMLGVAAGSAIKLDADENVHAGLTIGEGVETVMAARQLGFRPAWALGSAGSIASFPVLSGIESLTILAEADRTNAAAVEACAARWHAAGREVRIVRPRVGSDVNDALREIAA